MCACSSNLNYAHECIENLVNVLKYPSEPPKIKKIDTTPMLFYADTRKKIEIEKRQCISFCPER